MLIITKADIMAKCSEGAGWSEVITVVVYGVIGIVLMIGSYMISRELFGGLGGGVVNTLSSPSAAATAVGGAAVVGGQAAAASFGGGMLRGAGGYLSSQGARLGDGGAGKMMSSVGAGLSRIGTVLHNPVSRGISVAAAKPGSATGTANMAGQGMAGTGRRGSERPDEEYVEGLVKGVVNSRFGIVALLVVVIMMGIIILAMLKRPQLVAVVDSETGQTYASVAREVTTDVIERQLKFYSMRFVEDYLNLDYLMVKEARARAMEIMHPTLREQVQWSEEVNDAVKGQYGCSFEWMIKPVVTAVADPKYSVFCQLERVTTKKGYKPRREKLSLKLDWGRLRQNTDPYKRPHNLMLLGVNKLKEGSAELKEQLNLSYR